jgi:hypothetical protein
MATKKQIEANRKNSRKSTGPSTEQGKRVVSKNAVKWSVFSELVLLPDEDEKLLEGLARRVLADLHPVGGLETALADLIISCLWRWRRLHDIEAGLLMMYRVYEGADRGLATSFAHDASQMDSMGRLTRYETALERRFLRLLHELQRLQAVRVGAAVAPPVAVDVDVRGDEQGGLGAEATT